MECLCHAEGRWRQALHVSEGTARKGCQKGKRTGFVQELFDPIRSPDCQSHMGLAEVLDVFRKFEVLLVKRGISHPAHKPRDGESALTLAKSLPTSIRPSLVLILKLLTSLRAVPRQNNTGPFSEVDAPCVPAQVRHS